MTVYKECMVTGIPVLVCVVVLPMLPTEEVMKANFSKLTTSHQGDV